MAETQRVRFCDSFDGVKLAYTSSGSGQPLLQAGYSLSHLDHARHSPVWRHWIDELSRERAFFRYDPRGCGLSDRDVAEISFESLVRDLEAIADAAGMERFALIGHSHGAAVAVAYAARHPERVSHLVLCGGYARGMLRRGGGPEKVKESLFYNKLVEVGWGSDDPSFRRLFASQFMPDAPQEVVDAHDMLQRVVSSPATLVRFMIVAHQIDVTDLAPRVACPCLVVNSRDDRRIPLEEGRLLATLLPDARFVSLPSANHFLCEGEPAWQQFVQELRAFLPAGPGAQAEFAELTARERELLEFLARGLDNHQIAAHLDLSEKTVRNMVSSVLAKLDLESRSQAIVRARDAGFGQGRSES